MSGKIHAEDQNKEVSDILLPHKNKGTYAEFRRSVDELECDLLEVATGGVDHERLAEGDDTLFGSWYGALEHDEVIFDDTVVREAAHGCDGLLGCVSLGHGVRLILTAAEAVYLLVELSTVMVSICRNG